MHLRRAFLFTGAACAALAIFGGGIILGISFSEKQLIPVPVAELLTSHRDKPPEGVDFTPVWRAWNTLEDKFVSASTTRVITNEEKIYGLIAGLADSHGDPYTVFFPPEEAKMFQSEISGSFEGVGMEIGIREGVLMVTSPLKGSPAEKAGLRAGDAILTINGEKADDMPVDAAVKLIRGPRGTKVVFTVSREGSAETLTITVVRDVINIPTVDTKMENNVFVISLHSFSAVSSNLFRGALREFVESGTNKLVLDLRNNPGGYLEAAVDIGSWFLPMGKVIATEDYGTKGKPIIHRSRGYDIATGSNLEMAVLVNGGSASASEILAGALQEYDIAKLVGERTFGKGSVQELDIITEKTSLKVTVARWLTPKGRSISEHGLDPDLEAARTPENVEAGADPQLDAAISLLNGR